MRTNPATAVRGPKLSVTEGKTPNLPAEEVAVLIESIPTDTLVGLRDRALIGLMAYTFARVGAALSMNVGDYYPEGKQWSVRLREKGGKRKQIAVHHVLEEYMDAYLAATGLSEQKGTPLFRTARGKTGQLTENRMSQPDAWSMLQRRAKKAGITTAICNHSWRATGITVFLENGGAIEMAQYMAGHADPAHDQALRPPPATGDAGRGGADTVREETTDAGRRARIRKTAFQLAVFLMRVLVLL